MDLERIMILLQRQYNSIREISKFTNELEETLARNDQVSASMLLQMREDEMIKYDSCTEEIWKISEEGEAEQRKIKELMTLKPSHSFTTESPEEQRIYEIKYKTRSMIDDIKRVDRRINQNIIGEKSFYAK